MASPVVAPKKSSKAKVPPAHPPYIAMISQAIGTLKERGGSSRSAILKYILKNFKVGDNEIAVNSRVKLALKSGVKAGSLKQVKGTGASGSFRLGEKPKVAKPKKAAKKAVKKPAVKKATKSPKKATKSPKKATKSPKKAKKPAPAKPKKSPKKAAKKPAAKKPAAKKPAVKKPAAKKPAAKKAAAKK